MKRYEVTVNGQVYEVSLRELQDNETVTTTAPAQPAPPAATPAAPAPVTGEGLSVKAPMGGVIMSVKVKENQSVKAGDTLFILEAMKMENEIKAPQDGVVKSILVSESQQVETNQELVII
ncbi:biotin/lipoyl-binding protein [Tuanshanicoccus lijuaniae]|uniref:biotin/lipoyl-containing protein n=1 Tax=Aerococcaceae bacterium zg-1292 TaxID=2774330 RepID=UPI001936D878|nr:biotin/lipoyl-binding protein [Aerococcaceae bacterium zg-1292]MBF6626173.1 biotin/lipoyl-binding protein [Aerococcaceae bacterium zg-BR9]MBF6978033.1 biotin/lipoyl-binding protein [Aerococcaceae bacterium zg-BR22]MBS4456058.1 biotin/lipoyl-binding protein [Aerococcaceae bacterium zg-A91]MBS4457810.1 biotin/lipoyl-binding protein [Aerococcaceae bacterium zg-BR33]